MDEILILGFCLTGLSLIALLLWLHPRRGPVGVVWPFVREHAFSTHALFYLLTVVGIILLDILETRYDPQITGHLGWDFTSLFLRIEGPTAALFQLIQFPALTFALSVVYLYVFPVMGVVAVLAAYAGGERTLGRKIFWGTLFNYVLILPFYILVPVSERWAAGDESVSLLMNTISPVLIEGLRPLSGLNNCFPSFHTSLAVTYALLITESADRRLRRTMLVLAALVVHSTLYLGFHWVLDSFAGVLFAAVCTLLATYAVENYPLELAFLRSRK
jgi:membrane-associated phospholipid phosphatase